MYSLEFDMLLDGAVTLLRAAAAKEPALQPFADRITKRLDWRLMPVPARLDVLLYMQQLTLAHTLGVDVAALDLPGIIAEPVVTVHAPVGPPDLTYRYVPPEPSQRPRTPAQSISAMLGRALHPSEHAEIVGRLGNDAPEAPRAPDRPIAPSIQPRQGGVVEGEHVKIK
jgi:hypothetical protein